MTLTVKYKLNLDDKAITIDELTICSNELLMSIQTIVTIALSEEPLDDTQVSELITNAETSLHGAYSKTMRAIMNLEARLSDAKVE